MKTNDVNLNFFNHLFNKISQAFEKSDVNRLKENANWGFSISATEITKNTPMIIGFNWGVDKSLNDKGGHGNQMTYPQGNFGDKYNELGSFKRTYNLFGIYNQEAQKGMQTNFCFFRSEKENQISEKDIELCTPIFDELLEFCEPSMIISFSSRLKNYFITNDKIIINAEGELFLVGEYKNVSKKIPCIFLPHPNAKIQTGLRLEAWEFCFKKYYEIQKGNNLIFEYGCEGGGEDLRYFLNNEKKVEYKSTIDSMGLDDNDEESYNKTEKTYNKFIDFWKTFINSRNTWYLFFPIYVDNFIKKYIEVEIAKIDYDKIEDIPQAETALIEWKKLMQNVNNTKL